MVYDMVRSIVAMAALVATRVDGLPLWPVHNSKLPLLEECVFEGRAVLSQLVNVTAEEEANPQAMRIMCTNEASPDMILQGQTCETWGEMPGSRCTAPTSVNPDRASWLSNKYCQKTCWEMGSGYASDDCTTKVVAWMTPGCMISGKEVRVTAFLNPTNAGEIGIGDGSCEAPAKGSWQTEDPKPDVQLVHDLQNTWAVYWSFLYAGTYAICHRHHPSLPWVEQARMFLLPTSPPNCRAASKDWASCQFDESDNESMPFFDGWINEPTRRPNRCTSDCDDCIVAGGRCVCPASDCGTCGKCTEEQKVAGLCDCVDTVV